MITCRRVTNCFEPGVFVNVIAIWIVLWGYINALVYPVLCIPEKYVSCHNDLFKKLQRQADIYTTLQKQLLELLELCQSVQYDTWTTTTIKVQEGQSSCPETYFRRLLILSSVYSTFLSDLLLHDYEYYYFPLCITIIGRHPNIGACSGLI